MLDHKLHADMTRREILERVLAAERDMREVLEEAARLVRDPEERDLYLRLARLEEHAVRDLLQEEDRLEAEEFVRRAIDV